MWESFDASVFCPGQVGERESYLFLLSLQVLGRLLLSTHWTLDGEQPMHDLYTFQTEFLVSIVKFFLVLVVCLFVFKSLPYSGLA